MSTRTYVAADLHQALAAVRADLGIDAMIVKCETATDGRICLYANEPDNGGNEPEAAAQPSPPSATVVPFASFEARHRERLVANLRTDPAIRRRLPSLPFDRDALLAILDLHRVPDDLNEALAEDAETSALPDLALALAWAFDKRMRKTPASGIADANLIVGPFGAGKTSVAARLAAHAQGLGREVILVTTDLDGAGQMARLEALAAHLGLGVAAAPWRDNFVEILDAAQRNQSLVIADTAGFDPRKPDPHPCAGIEGVESLGVASASSDAEEARDFAAGFMRHGVKRLIVTGLDSARRKGALVVYATSGLAVTEITASPFFCDGIEPFSPLRLARELLSPMD